MGGQCELVLGCQLHHRYFRETAWMPDSTTDGLNGRDRPNHADEGRIRSVGESSRFVPSG
jgi:hypothetical protein